MINVWLRTVRPGRKLYTALLESQLLLHYPSSEADRVLHLVASDLAASIADTHC